MECSQMAAWTSRRNLLVASCVKAFSGRPTNPARWHPDLHTCFAAFVFFTGVVDPSLHLRLLLLRAGDIKLNLGTTCFGCNQLILCDSTPIVCSTCQRHFHRTCSRKMVLKAWMVCMRDNAIKGWSHVGRCWINSRVRGDTLMTPDRTAIKVRSSG